MLWVLFQQAANSVTGVKTEPDGESFEISGKTGQRGGRVRRPANAIRDACLRDYGHGGNIHIIDNDGEETKRQYATLGTFSMDAFRDAVVCAFLCVET